MIFAKRRACNGRLTIGRSKEGLPLVGFKYRKADDWLDLNSKQEGVRLVGFKYQKGYDWLISQFHCSYLESRGVPGKTRGKTREIISLSFPVHDFRCCNFRSSMRTRSLPVPPHSTPSNDKWMVHLYYSSEGWAKQGKDFSLPLSKYIHPCT